MTPGFAWALLVVMSVNTDIPAPPTWYATREECEAHAAIRVVHYEMTNRPVSYVACQRMRLPATR